MEADDQPERRTEHRVGLATVLVVDDSTAIRRILRRSLEAAGYRVREAADGLAALEACRTERPDLMLLDVDMPVMDGPTALATMKQDTSLVDIPVLFLTARTSGAEVAAGLRLGAQDYLRKPCDPDELAARVANVLQQKITRDTLELQAAEADRLSTTDLLTGLANRRMLEHRLAEMLVSYGTESTAAGLIIDVDHFKQVNDAEGHLIGDVVLRILASRLRSAVDYPRLLVRWGGEEFVVLAPQIASGTAVAELGEELCAKVNATPFAIDQGRVLGITVSVGGASGRLGAFNSLIATADDALYAAKRGGRNRVVTRVA